MRDINHLSGCASDWSVTPQGHRQLEARGELATSRFVHATIV